MFHRTRLTLTTWYLLIIMLVSISFSVVIFRFLSTEVERFEQMQRFRMERRLRERLLFPSTLPLLSVNEELIIEIKQRIGFILVSVNGIIFVLAGWLGYILAGKTLKPIANMVSEQQRFVSDASHELKTPLTSLKSAFEVYLRDKNRTKKDADTVIAESITEVDKLQSLTESLLSLAHATNAPKTSWEIASLSELVTKAQTALQKQANEKNIQITLVTNTATVYCQPENVKRIFVIILENAIKYSPQNSYINIRMTTKTNKAIVTITDHGIGIDKEDLPYVFDRFYRSDTARVKSGANGFGLGLAIAKQLVESHHGTITATSKKNLGTTFTVVLPMTQKKRTNSSG